MSIHNQPRMTQQETDARQQFLDAEESIREALRKRKPPHPEDPRRSMGTPFDMVKPKGERGKRGERDANENVLEKLLSKGKIEQPEYEAGLHYHKLLCSASTGLNAMDLARVDGGGQSGGNAMIEATAELASINRSQGMSRAYRMVLWFALHPKEHRCLSEIDEVMNFPKRMMVGRTILIEALKELAEILGYSDMKRGR